MLWFERRVLSIPENMWIPPCDSSLKVERAGASPGKAHFVTRSRNLQLTKRAARRDLWRSRACARFESAIRPTVCPIPRPPKDDDQYRYQDHQQVVKVEFKSRVKPLKMNELIDQGHPLFIGKFLNSEASYEHGEVGNRVRYVEKHLEPPLISLNNQDAGAAVRLVLQGCAGRRREGRLKDCYFRV